MAVALCAGLVSIPAQAQQRARSATARGLAPRGYLGVGVAELTEDRVKALHLSDDHGVEVKHVEDGSAASRAGLKENDVILEVNNKGVEDLDSFQTTIAEMAPGTKLSMTIWRNGAKQTVSAVLEQRPAGLSMFLTPDAPVPPMPPMPPLGPAVVPFPANTPMIGFEGESLTAQLAEYFGVKDGVLVRTVNANTPAQRAGLKAGDVVTKVNNTPVMSPREISGIVHSERKKEVSFTVVRNKKEMPMKIDLGDQQ